MKNTKNTLIKVFKQQTIWLIAFLFGQSLLWAQPINSQIKDVVMPAPNAASLGKYGDIPVSTYTGVPNIGIPIHTLKEGSLSLPISLSYHAGGVKVGEPCSWVGLGWSLQAGGMISRMVQGKADESGFGYFSIGKDINVTYNTLYGAECITGPHTNQEFVGGSKDPEPDIFSFSVGGYNGKFYIDADMTNDGIINGKVIVIPKQDIIITYDPPSNTTLERTRLKNFTMTTPDGTKYLFGNIDASTTDKGIEVNKNNENNLFQQASGWYLRRIVSADGISWINLDYTQENYRYGYRSKAGPVCPSNCYPKPVAGGYYQNIVDVTGWRLSSITSSSNLETISFVANDLRTDLNNNVAGFEAKELDAIKIQTGSYCKQFNLTQSYFVDDNTTIKTGIPHHDNRLKLLSVQEKSCDGTTTIPPHTFSYYGKTGNENYLPNKLSSAIDHWGYYNDATGNTKANFNIPTTRIKYESQLGISPGATVPTTTIIDVTKGNSNRETNETAIKWGTLNKINYPTGGSTAFDLEANTYFDTSDRTYLVDQNVLERYWPTGQCTNDYTTPNIVLPSFTKTFANQAEIDAAYFKAEIIPGPQFSPSCCNPSPSVSIAVYYPDGSKGISMNVGCTSPVSSLTNELNNVNNGFGPLQPGIPYIFKLVGQNCAARFILQKQMKEPWNINRPVGGLRVKSITSTDGTAGGIPVIKNYVYEASNIPNRSSGLLYNKPTYGILYSNCVGHCNGIVSGSTTCGNYGSPLKNHFFFDYPIIPLGSFEGNHIGYSAVKEYYTNSTNGYHTLYQYKNELPTSVFNDIIPIPPLQPRIGSGELTSKTQKGTAQEIAYEIYNEKGETNEVNQGTFLRFNTYLSGGEGTPVTFWSKYKIINRPYRLSSVQSVVDDISTTTNYTYGSTSHLMPTKVSTTNSDGKVTETQTDYSFDVTDATVLDASTKAKLVALNIITPIETRTLVAGNQLSGSRTIYKNFSNLTGVQTPAASTTDFPRPNQFYNYERTFTQANPTDIPVIAAGAWVLKGTINNYTGTATTGNKPGLPASFTKIDWKPEFYTWNLAGNIVQRKFEAFTWNYTYETGTNMVNKMTNPDGQFVSYTYDKLMRLQTSTARGGAVKTDYAYTYPTLTNGVITTFGNIKQTNTFAPVAGSPINVQESFTYFDGLGRNIESVKKGSYTSLDQISAVEYDNQGRVSKSYETFIGGYNAGTYQSPTGKAHTLTTYYDDPLSRTKSVTPPSWYATTSEYATNIASEVLKYDYAVSVTNGTYAANELSKTTVIDANGNKTIAFKDKKGRLICMRKTNNIGDNKTDTYYLYDDKDRLAKVITPGATWSNPELNYYYNYQGNDLIARKKVPGKAIEQFQYNKRDLPALYQDGFLRNNLKWMGTSYDDYGRLLVKGINSNYKLDALTFTNKIIENSYGTTATDKDKLVTSKVMQFNANDPVINPIAANAITTKNITYDAFGRASSIKGNNHLQPTNLTAEKMNYTYDNADNILSEKREVSHGTGPFNTIINTRTFDNWGRLRGVVQSIDGVSTTLNALQYTPKNQVSSKTIGGGLQTVDYAYLENGLLKSINGETKLSNSNFITPTMLTNFSTPTFTATAGEDLFQEVLRYDQAYNMLSSTGATEPTPNFVAQKNGNIAQAVWQVKGRTQQYYNYDYDYLDRISNAKYSEFGTTGTATNYNYFNERPVYDLRGNITTMARTGMSIGKNTTGVANTFYTNEAIDIMTYTYNPLSNQIQSIADAGNVGEGFKKSAATGQYTYDNNGNMLFDPNKNLTITYNHLNLPSKFTFTGNNSIEIMYDAAGQKLRKTVKTNNVVTLTQDYLGGIELKNNRLEAIYNEEGRAYNTSNATQSYPYNWRYEYNLKDHLGNTRVVFCDKNKNGIIENQTELLSETHYYPFGMAFGGAWYNDASAAKYKYLYNGKELNEEFGLNLSDYGARWYDAAIGRWWNVDPLAQIDAAFSPYNYVTNNPLKFVDYFGMFGGPPPGGETNLPELVVTAKAPERSNNVSFSAFYGSLWSQYDSQSSPNPYTFSHAQNEKIAAGITTVLTAGVAAEAGAIGYGLQRLSNGGAWLWNHKMGLGRLAMRQANKYLFDFSGAKSLWMSKAAVSLTMQTGTGLANGKVKIDGIDLLSDIFLQPLAGAISSTQIDFGLNITDGGFFFNAGDNSLNGWANMALGFASNKVEGFLAEGLVDNFSSGTANAYNYSLQIIQKLYFTMVGGVANEKIDNYGKK